MEQSLGVLVGSYDPRAPLERASTIPSSWYTDGRVLELERRTVFARSWLVAGRVGQVERPGRFLSCHLPGGEPVVVVRGLDGELRAFFNVCRHHAAEVATMAEGSAQVLRCPYHGWTYGLDGRLKGTPDFAGVCDFDPDEHGLVPLDIGVWEKWVFVKVERGGPDLNACLGDDLMRRVGALNLTNLHWAERRSYVVACNWKVYIDNYLDGGYHVPHLHRGLGSVLDYSRYTIETGERFCLQQSPIAGEGGDERTSAVRTGDRAFYLWVYPNFMINWYAGAMDTNLVVPRGPDRTEVIFDYYFADVSESARARNETSIAVSEQIQSEDEAVCASVQRGLASRAYRAGRLSVRREAGEHLFHRLLHADLSAGLESS